MQSTRRPDGVIAEEPSRDGLTVALDDTLDRLGIHPYEEDMGGAGPVGADGVSDLGREVIELLEEDLVATTELGDRLGRSGRVVVDDHERGIGIMAEPGVDRPPQFGLGEPAGRQSVLAAIDSPPGGLSALQGNTAVNGGRGGSGSGHELTTGTEHRGMTEGLLGLELDGQGANRRLDIGGGKGVGHRRPVDGVARPGSRVKSIGSADTIG